MPRKTYRKPRTCSIQLDPSNYHELDGLVVDLNTQKLKGLKDGEHYSLIGSSLLEYTRERDNKAPKVLHSSMSASEDVWFSSNHQLLSYDHLIAVDTNTHFAGGSTVSVTAAYHLIPEAQIEGGVHCRATVLALVELWNVVEKPENLGWWQILQAIFKRPQDYPGKIGLIVDSDLGNHKAFNAREMPIYSDYFLPENVTILYGSDRGGAEHLSTKMIKYCHDLASDLYKNQPLMLSSANLHEGIEGFYTHIRQWDPEVLDLRAFCNVRG